MSKIVRQRYEIAALSDTPLTVAVAGYGYSPTLPTPPGTVGGNDVGITATDAYSSDTALSVGSQYGVLNISDTTPDVFAPLASNMLIYNPRVPGATAAVLNVLQANTTTTLADVAFQCPVGAIISIPASIKSATSVMYFDAGANVTVFWYL